MLLLGVRACEYAVIDDCDRRPQLAGAGRGLATARRLESMPVPLPAGGFRSAANGRAVRGRVPKHETYGLNPQFVLTPSVPGSFTIELSQPADAPALLPIGIVVLNREVGAPFKPKLSTKRLVAKTNYKATAVQTLTVQLDSCPPQARASCCCPRRSSRSSTATSR